MMKMNRFSYAVLDNLPEGPIDSFEREIRGPSMNGKSFALEMKMKPYSVL